MKIQIWGKAPGLAPYWPNHFESTKKVTQLIEQVNVM